MKIKTLTPKQIKFCEKYVETGNKMEAYKQSYASSNMQYTTINKCVNDLFANPLITTHIIELQRLLAGKFEHTVEDAIKMDFDIINKYNRFISILENTISTPKDIEAAARTMKFIGINAYNGAMDRISKRMGFYEKDNTQKAPTGLDTIKVTIVRPDTNE